MKTSSLEVNGWAFQVSHHAFNRFAHVILIVFLAAQAFGQAPTLLWSTNIGATLFAVDDQTNSYANSGGSVIVINPNGLPVSTNVICPRSGIAIRDADGNYYFAGLMPGHTYNGFNTSFDPQDFGGITLSNMPIFVVKYSSAGTLLWATNIGPLSVLGIGLQDFVMDGEGNLVVSFGYSLGSSSRFQTTAKFGSIGSQVWESTTHLQLGETVTDVRLSLYSSTNFYEMTYHTLPSASLARLDGSGTKTPITSWTSAFGFTINPPQVILNSAGDLYNVEGNPNVNLTKRDSTGAIRWNVDTGTAQRGVGRDQYDGVHVASDANDLSRYDIDGNLAWTRSLPAKCVSLLLDSSGNRFLSLSGGIVARLGGETLVAPLITNAPSGQKVFTGTNVVLTVGASGTTPLRYYWIKDGSFIGSGTKGVTGSDAQWNRGLKSILGYQRNRPGSLEGFCIFEVVHER